MLPETRPLLGRRLTLHLSQSIGNIHPTKGRSLFDIAPRCLTLHTSAIAHFCPLHPQTIPQAVAAIRPQTHPAVAWWAVNSWPSKRATVARDIVKDGKDTACSYKPECSTDYLQAVTKRAGRKKDAAQQPQAASGGQPQIRKAAYETSKKKEVGVSDLTLISKISNEAINDNLKKRFETLSATSESTRIRCCRATRERTDSKCLLMSSRLRKAHTTT
jgi:hypothetical protein